MNNINNFSFPCTSFHLLPINCLSFSLQSLIHFEFILPWNIAIYWISMKYSIWVYWAFSHSTSSLSSNAWLSWQRKEIQVVNSFKSSKCRLCSLTRIFISNTNLSMLQAMKKEFVKTKNNSNVRNERLKIQSVIFLFECTAVTCTWKVSQEIFFCWDKFE